MNLQHASPQLSTRRLPPRPARAQVSHHIHCNADLDEDVISAFPFLRFDARLPRAWYHKYQHIYMWATFPLLTLVFTVRWVGADPRASPEQSPAARVRIQAPNQARHTRQPPYPRCPTPTLHQAGDIKALFDNRTHGASLYGAGAWERTTVVLGKLAHFGLLLALPWALHGPGATLAGALAYTVTQVRAGVRSGAGVVRASTQLRRRAHVLAVLPCAL